ncbi:MAG: WecB/TagA/CpsF family glycosyltransferase [Clostridia bacterium]|nr:WecB/TagA/CpsF family glycosyltransferase [Clostridia bacterium]
MKEKTCRLFDFDIAVGTRDELLSYAASLVGVGGAVCTVNPEILTEAMGDRTLSRYLHSSVNIPDGVGVRHALRVRGVRTDTLPGVELGEELLDITPVRLGIIGGREGIAEAALASLASRHPSVTPVLAASGFGYRYLEYREMIENSGADLVYVCLGCPKQERLILHMREYFPSVLFIGLGGSADVYAGAVRRAPRIFRRLGGEWIWRILSEPQRILRLPRLFRFAKRAFFSENPLKFRQKRIKPTAFFKKTSEN